MKDEDYLKLVSFDTEKVSHNDYDTQTVIRYNGKEFGRWENCANTDYPEDLSFGRDLDDLIFIGIEIGKEIAIDKLKNKFA